MPPGAMKIEVPAPDSVRAGFLRPSSLQEIKNHREMSKGETIPGPGGGTNFSIRVNLPNDAAVDRAKSIEFAEILVGKL